MALVPIEMLRVNMSALDMEREKAGGVVYVSSVDAGDEDMRKLGYPVEVLPGTGR